MVYPLKENKSNKKKFLRWIYMFSRMQRRTPKMFALDLHFNNAGFVSSTCCIVAQKIKHLENTDFECFPNVSSFAYPCNRRRRGETPCINYMQYPSGYAVLVIHILSTSEDMQNPWVNLYKRRMNEILFTGTAYPHRYCIPSTELIIWLTGTEGMTHGYWGCDSRVLHIVYTGWEMRE